MGEAEAMILVRNSTSAPVPEVLNAYTIEDIGFILMRKIPGVTLQACWEIFLRIPKYTSWTNPEAMYMNGAALKACSLGL
jgi:hypothetical protein